MTGRDIGVVSMVGCGPSGLDRSWGVVYGGP